MDIELNSKGRKQARKLARRLEDQSFNKVYSSDLQRASDTAAEIVKYSDVAHEETEKLRERSYGELEGKPHSVRKNYIEEGDELDSFQPENGESIWDLRSRVRTFIDQVMERHKDEGIVVVAHGWTNRAIITELLDSGEGHAHQLEQGNTCVNRMRKEDFRGWKIEKLNDTSHLR